MFEIIFPSAKDVILIAEKGNVIVVDESSRVRFLTAKTPDGFPQQFAGLSEIWIQFMSKILRLYFGLNCHMSFGRLFLSVPSLWSSFYARIVSSSSWFRHEVTLFGTICHTESFLSAYARSRWSYSCFEQPPVHRPDRCAFCELSENGWYTVCKGLLYFLVRQSLPLYSIGSPILAHSWKLCAFLDRISREPSGDLSAILHTIWHEHLTLGTNQLKRYRNLGVVVDSTNLCTKV